MRTIDKRLGAGVKMARPLVERAATLTLPFESRCKSRLAATLDSGEEVALLMPRGTILAHGDLLVADDGALVRVIAASEAILRVSATTPLDLMRAAYHLGNRHTPVEIGADYLQLEADPVLRAMLEGIGATVEGRTAPFHPEAGAYGGGHRHGHDSSFAEDYALAQQVYDEHDAAHASGKAHAHADHAHSHPHPHQHDEHCGHHHGPSSKAATPVAVQPHQHDEHCGHHHGASSPAETPVVFRPHAKR